MGIKISDSRSFKLEPVTKNRFVFQFSAVPGNTDGQEEALAFVAKSAGIPEMTFGTVETKRMNETYKTAGTMTWNTISLSFNDYIRNTTANELSAGDIMYNWSSIIYNPLTGQMGYKTQYATSATEAQLDPAGNIFRAWNIFGCWPQKVSFGGNLSYDEAAINTIDVDLIYDQAIKVQDSTTSSESA